MNNIKEAITDRWENSANGYDTYIQGEINTFKRKGLERFNFIRI